MRLGITSQIADCHTCGKVFEGDGDGKAQKAAYYHAKKKNHLVTGQTVTAWHYDFRH